jgi:hypothetical protein
MAATISIPHNGCPIHQGTGRMLYISPKDIKRAMAWGTDLDNYNSIEFVNDVNDGFTRFRFGKDGKYIYARQSIMLVPLERITYMSYGADTPENSKGDVGENKWSVIVNLYPAGKPSMVKMIYPTGGRTMMARKVVEIATCLWKAYYGQEDVKRKLAGEILMGTENICTRYDPATVARGHMPPELAEIRNTKINNAMLWIDSAVQKKARFLLSDSGDIILHLWWLSENAGVETWK